MIVPDWFIALLQALGLKDTPEKAKNKKIKMYESELRKLDARIKQNKAQIESFELDLNELENEKKQLMSKYKTVTDATQKKMLAANYDATTNKINSINQSGTIIFLILSFCYSCSFVNIAEIRKHF